MPGSGSAYLVIADRVRGSIFPRWSLNGNVVFNAIFTTMVYCRCVSVHISLGLLDRWGSSWSANTCKSIKMPPYRVFSLDVPRPSIEAPWTTLSKRPYSTLFGQASPDPAQEKTTATVERREPGHNQARGCEGRRYLGRGQGRQGESGGRRLHRYL